MRDSSVFNYVGLKIILKIIVTSENSKWMIMMFDETKGDKIDMKLNM